MADKKNSFGNLTTRDTEMAILAWRALKSTDVCEDIATPNYRFNCKRPSEPAYCYAFHFQSVLPCYSSLYPNSSRTFAEQSETC